MSIFDNLICAHDFVSVFRVSKLYSWILTICNFSVTIGRKYILFYFEDKIVKLVNNGVLFTIS